MKKALTIKTSKSGVFLHSADGETRIAAPIRFHAIGERLDRTKVVEFTFVNCDGQALSEQFDMAAINPRNLSIIADALANKGYLWPPDGVSSMEILRAVVAKIPERRFKFVGAPGWYEDAVITPLRQYGGSTRIVIDPNTGAHLASYTKGSGSLKDWQSTVGKLATKSTRLRLSIAAALAAPLLRPLRIESFAINLFGPTSQGKTTLLHGAASVPGLHNERAGLPKWADSETAIEELAIGHRDGLLPLDESGDQGGSMSPHKKAKQLAFLLSRDRAKTLHKKYQKKINLTDRDFRVIALSTSETALKEVAEAAGHPRDGGEGVRFIDVPATEPGSLGVFDRVTVPSGRDPGEFGRTLADNLRRDSEINQGFPMDAFLKRFMKDREAALDRIQQHMDSFRANLSMNLDPGPDQRISAKFALMYAAAALGIEYKILPWKKKKTRNAIETCMAGAFATLRNASPLAAQGVETRSIGTVAVAVENELVRLMIIPVKKRTICSEGEVARRASADGFRMGNEILIKPKSWKPSDAAKRFLIEHQILKTVRNDVATIERKVMGVPGKPRYYIINEDKLAEVITTVSDRAA